MGVFRDPRFDDARSVDLDAHLRLLAEGAHCKGVFFSHFLDLAPGPIARRQILERSGLAERRYLPFHNYPMVEHLRLIHAAASVLHPMVPVGEGLRRLGRTAYDGLLGSHVGRVVFGAFGFDMERILLLGGKAIATVTSFHGVHAEKVAERTLHVGYRDIPAFLETYHVGVIEGVMRRFGVAGRVRTEVRDLANATHEVTW